MLKRKYLTHWVLGLAMATAFFIALKATQYFRYENSDDILFVKSFMGYEGGVPAAFSTLLHPVLSRPLQWLSLLFPGIPWFSVLQLAFLFLSSVVICKSSLQCAHNHSLPLWSGAGIGFLFLCVFVLFPTCRINHTTTASLLGTAAIFQLFSIPYQRATNGALLRGLMFSLLLLALGYCLRQESAIPSFLFWLLSLLLIVLEPLALATSQNNKPRLRKPVLTALVALGVSFFILFGIREIELSTLQQRDLLSWNSARINLMDHHEDAFDLVTDAQLSEIGWSRAELALVRDWYFMDQNITTEALNQLSQVHIDAAQIGIGDKLRTAFQTVLAFFLSRPAYLFSGALLVVLCAFCVFLCLHKETKNLLGAAAACCSLLLVPALLLYLSLEGRLISRAADCAILPAATLLCIFTFSCITWPKGHFSYRLAVSLLCAVCLGLSAGNLYSTTRLLRAKPDTVSPTRQATLESFGLAHGDQLILYSPNLLRDTRLFPDVSAGIPTNLMIWGDWYCRTPSWLYQLSTFGIDGTAFTPQDFLRENLLFATADDEPPAALLAYLTESLGPIAYQQYDESGDLRFFQFIPKEGTSYGL